jgi:TonB-linked SusC/RagA family outer membrane protein
MKRLSLILTMVLFVVGFAVAQRTITGTVGDAKGEPMVGASVLAKGTTIGAVTDIDGKFTVNAPANATVLVFSFAGYQSQEVTLGASNVININLAEAQLQEVVVTAIGIQREKKALGYSATDIKGEDLAQKSESDPLRALTSKVPGVNIVGGGGAPGQSTKINIRGYSSLTGNTQPLFVVDGIPFDNSVNASTNSNSGTQYSNRAFDIDPNNIESMTILKGAAAAALYGSRATNGVVVITTKAGKKSRKGLEVQFNSSSSVEQISNLPNYQGVYTQGSNQAYSGAFIGNWGPPMPTEVDRINNTYYGGQKNYTQTYAAGYGDGQAPHPLVASGYYGETRFRGVFPELVTTVAGAANGVPITLQPYDFLKKFFNQGLLTENALTFNAGGENTGLSFTVSRMDNKGILPMYKEKELGGATDVANDWGGKNWEQAKTSRTSLAMGGNAKLANGLTIIGGVTYVNTQQETPPVAPSYFSDYGSSGDATIFSRLFYLPRNYNLIGYPFENPVSRNNVFYRALDNPLWLAKYSRYKSNVNRAFGNLTLSYDVTPWLNLSAKGGVNTYNDQRKSVIKSGGVFDPNGRIWTDNIINTEVDMNYIATFSHKLTSDLDLRIIGGLNTNQRRYEETFTDADGIITPTLLNVGATTTQLVSDYRRLQRLWAVYADAQLSYKNYLYLGLVARNDHTSTLLRPDGTGSNSYFYPGVNLSFAFTDAFQMKSNILSFGKIRAAYTQVGNEATPYRTATTYSFLTPFVTSTGGRINQATLGNTLGNANLRNELTKELEFGTDLRFFRNRIGLDFTWFKRNSIDQITSADLPRSSGFNTAIINAGEIQNKGIEIGLDLTPIKTNSGFTWNAFVNFSRIRSLIVNLGTGADAPTEIVLGVPGTSFGTIYRVGQPYGQIYGTALARAEDGKMLIDQSSGLTTRQAKNQIIGNPNADFTLGWRNTLSFKGLSLSWLFDWKQGGDLFSITAASLMLRGQLAFSANREALRVIPGYNADPANPSQPLLVDGKPVKNTTPITAFESHFTDGFGAYGADEVNVYDATTLRLREVSLGYEIPKKLLKKTPFGQAKLSLSGRNLWFFAPNLLKDLNMDPEVLPETASSNVQGFEFGATPTTRRYGINLYLTF